MDKQNELVFSANMFIFNTVMMWHDNKDVLSVLFAEYALGEIIRNQGNTYDEYMNSGDAEILRILVSTHDKDIVLKIFFVERKDYQPSTSDDLINALMIASVETMFDNFDKLSEKKRQFDEGYCRNSIVH